jgi:FtsZ-binding cell division protein ZapB
MFDVIVGVLLVFMILRIVVATVDCVVKMWPVKPFVDERTARQRVSQDFSFQVEQLQATVADRDKTLSCLLNEVQELREFKNVQYKERADANELLSMEVADLAEMNCRLQHHKQEHEQTIADGKKIIDELRERSIRSTERIQFLTYRNGELDRILNALRKDFRDLELNVETRGGQVPDLNTAWHMIGKPVDEKQKYLLDDTPLDDSGSGVIDSKPYGE